MAAVGHFGCPKFTLDHISGYFRSIQIFYFFLFFLTKWLPVAILDVRKSLSISFLAISDQYTTLIFVEIFDKMAAVCHFGCNVRKFTLDHISGHFRSIQIFDFFDIFLQNGCRWPFWMSENHFRSIFWPFQKDTQLKFCLKFLTKWLTLAILDVRNWGARWGGVPNLVFNKKCRAYS